MLKPQDLYLTVALAVLHKRHEAATVRDLAKLSGLSVAETHQGLRRAEAAHLLQSGRRVPLASNVLEFLTHGVRYAFAAEWLPTTRGVATAVGAPGLGDLIGQQAPVWPYESGAATGPGLRPLYPSVPKAALADRDLYRALAAIDCVRVGRARERAVGLAVLNELLGGNDGQPD